MRIAYCTLEGRSGHEAGRELLQKLYREVTGNDLPPIVTTDLGKPCFLDSSLYFSISHTPNHAFCVLSEHNVGLDAEELDRKINLKLADKILSPMEKAQFEEAPDPHRALLTFWVLKEADGKRTGKGLRVYPNHTNFPLGHPGVKEIDGCLVAVLEEGESYAV